MDAYLTLLGAHAYAQLVAKLKTMRVSTVGALFLLRDCKEYQEVVREFHIAAVSGALPRALLRVNPFPSLTLCHCRIV